MGDEKKDSFFKRTGRAIDRWLSQPSPFTMGVVGYNAHLAVKAAEAIKKEQDRFDRLHNPDICDKCGGTKVFDRTMPGCLCNRSIYAEAAASMRGVKTVDGQDRKVGKLAELAMGYGAQNPVDKVKDIADKMDATLDFKFAPSREHARRPGNHDHGTAFDYFLDGKIVHVEIQTFFVIASDNNAALIVAQLIVQGRVPNCYPNMADAIRQHNTVYPSYTDKKYKVFQVIKSDTLNVVEVHD